ncbi:hypothetical protein FRC12_008247 [Ceratobasidium sp. 428]|nr:hypothetical protein FRC12_008247 [Ceratobasidium sp. 428]
MSSSRKQTEFDPESIAASPDGTVHDSTATRTKQAAKSAKASAATEIEASQFTGDDSVVREPLLEFIPPSETGGPSPAGKPSRQVSSVQRPSACSSGLKGALPSTGQPTPTSAHAWVNSAQTPRAHQQNQGGPSQSHRPNTAASAPGPSGHPTSAREAINMLSQKGRIEKPAPTQVVHPQVQEPYQPEERIEDDDDEGEPEPEEEEAPNAGKGTKGRGLGKAYINSFPVDQQDSITVMVGLSKVRCLANGTYDQTESTLYEPYKLDWPTDWKARQTRTEIVSQSLTQACKETFRDTELPFCLRHVQATGIAITTMRSMAVKEVKHVVDVHFQFLPEKCDWNKNMAESLLPLNFVFKHVGHQEHPFENQLLTNACRAVVFSKDCAIGARYRDELKGTPPGFLCFICTPIKFVILGYSTGEWSNLKLDVEVQTTAFRQCLRFLMETHYKKRNSLTNIRTRMWDLSESSKMC